MPLTKVPIDDFSKRVAIGGVAGVSLVTKFGRGLVGATEVDIWDGGINYVFLTIPQILYISSSSSLDTLSLILVEGLGVNGEYQTETIVLDSGNSQTQVATTKQFIRIFRMQNITNNNTWAGVSSLNGSVYCSKILGDIALGIPNTATDIQAIIQVGEEQTQMGIYTIPLGYTGIAVSFIITGERDKAFTIRAKSRPFGGSFRTKIIYGSVNPQISQVFQFIGQLHEMNDVKFTGLIAAGTGTISVVFEILLFSNDLVNPLIFDENALGA